MKMQFLGAARTVTGSSILLDTGSERVLVDCGLYQGTRELEERNFLGFDYQPAEIDFVLLTHAHIDHSGLLPRLWKLGFRGKIVCTAATSDMCRVLLLDSASIHERDAYQKAKRRKKEQLPAREPLYVTADAQGVLEHFEGHPYNQKIQISKSLSVRFRDAGHILGSSSIEVWASDRRGEVKLGFSGDLGNHPTPILREPQPIEEADYLVIESTYGDRLHDAPTEKVERLRRIIVETEARGGRLIIPAFAVGRTQELLYYLNELVEADRIPRLPVFVDSPMATDATEIYRRHTECYDEEARALLTGGDSPFSFPGLSFTRDLSESKALNDLDRPCIVISASGMATHGRIRNHLAHGLPDARNTVLFVGFQALGTLGRRLMEGGGNVHIFGEEVEVRARVDSISGLSAHADKKGLLRWLHGLRDEPHRVLVNHGEEGPALAFSEAIHQELGFTTSVPEPKETIALETRPVGRPSSVEPWLLRDVGRLEREILRWADRSAALLGQVEGDGDTVVVLDDLHKALGKLIEAVLAGTRGVLRRELAARGWQESKEWSELQGLLESRQDALMSHHAELRSTLLRLFERLDA